MEMASSTPNEPSSIIYGLCLEDACHRIDAEISVLQERIYSLRALRNSLAPISKIPTEILSRIFSYTQDHGYPPFGDVMDIATRFHVSWVCRHWRNTALVTPNLWTVVSKKSRDVPIHMDFAQEMFNRSRNLGLIVGLFEPATDVMKACLSQMFRIQHLRLVFPSMLSDELDHLSLGPAPLLTSLDFEFHNITSPFSGQYPHLHHLVVTGFFLKPESPLITSAITSLHIIRPILRPGFSYLILMITSLPRLTELTLVDCFNSGFVVTQGSQLCRPLLQVVAITDEHIVPLLKFLARLYIPQAAVALTWPEDVNISQDTLAFYALIFNNYRHEIPFDIHHLEIRYDLPDFHVNLSSSQIQHRYAIHFPQLALDPVDMEPLLSAIELGNLESISVNILPGNLVHRLGDLTYLKYITLDKNEALQDFVLGFKPDLAAIADTFTVIEELWLRKIEEQLDNEVDGFEEALVVRQKLGLGLPRLVLEKCSGLDSTRFEAVVDRIVVID